MIMLICIYAIANERGRTIRFSSSFEERFRTYAKSAGDVVGEEARGTEPEFLPLMSPKTL